MKILVLDDEESLRLAIKDELSDKGHSVHAFSDPIEAFNVINLDEFDCVISDIKMPKMNGYELLKRIKGVNPEIPIILITAYPDTSAAVKCMKEGAYDYLVKPIEVDMLAIIVEKLESLRKLQDENLRLQQALKEKHDVCRIIGKSAGIKKVLDKVKNYAQSDAPVLIEGETGTGKELFADAIHYNSSRHNMSFVKINCSVFSKDLIESELFGHEKGAYTGAYKSKKGRFETADKGTVFLDEVDDLPPDIQLKLLRVLENQEIEKVGSENKMDVDIRIIVATKTNLKQKIEDGSFRKDFYYRLHVLPLYIPPLRERVKDIPLLIQHFLYKFSSENKITIDEEALHNLMHYAWPGNVRELEHIIEYLCITVKSGIVMKKDLPEELLVNYRNCSPLYLKSTSYDRSMVEFEKMLLTSALEQTGGNRKKAAQNLNIPYSTLRHRLEKFGI